MAGGAKTQVFELDQNGDGEAVVDRRVLDIDRCELGLGKRLGTREARARVGQVKGAAALVLDGLARTPDTHHRAAQRACNFGPRHDQRAAAIGHHTAIEPVQRVGHHRRGQHVVHRQHLAQQGVGVVLGVVRGRHLDPGQLRTGGAVLVHVALRAHGVAVGVGNAVGVLPLKIRL